MVRWCSKSSCPYSGRSAVQACRQRRARTSSPSEGTLPCPCAKIKARTVTKAIIFDLDSCLSPADEPGQQLFAPAFDAIADANRGLLSPPVLQNAFADMWRLPFDFVAEKYGFTPAMKGAGWQVLAQLEVTTPMSGYGDLAVLKGLPVPKFVVTSGFRRLQESKVRALGGRSWPS